MRRTLAIVVLVVAGSMAAAAPAAAQELPVPAGYAVTSHQQLAPGIDHFALQRQGPAVRVHVARVASAARGRLRPVLSNGAVAEQGRPLERTSSMCERLKCLAGVNGDFFLPDGGPLGGMVIDGQVVRAPNSQHHQLMLTADGGLRTGQFSMSATLVPTDLRSASIGGVNVARQSDQLVLYLPSYGANTGTNEFGNELLFDLVDPAAPILAGHTTLVRFTGLRQGGNTAIPPAGGVLSGHGTAAAALADLWERVQRGVAGATALLRLETDPPLAQAIGGSPILVREGRRWVPAEGRDNFVMGRHPRTMSGWTAGGDLLLVTADGRQPGYSEGLTLPEAADLMLALGAVEAINLDGGGSTTFVVRGQVANSPSDRLVRRDGREAIVHGPLRADRLMGNVERPVASALMILGQEAAPPERDEPLERAEIGVRPGAAAVAIVGLDPASNPLARLPALVRTGSGGMGRSTSLAIVAALLLGATTTLTATNLPAVRRRRHPAGG